MDCKKARATIPVYMQRPFTGKVTWVGTVLDGCNEYDGISLEGYTYNAVGRDESWTRDVFVVNAHRYGKRDLSWINIGDTLHMWHHTTSYGATEWMATLIVPLEVITAAKAEMLSELISKYTRMEISLKAKLVSCELKLASLRGN